MSQRGRGAGLRTSAILRRHAGFCVAFVGGWIVATLGDAHAGLAGLQRIGLGGGQSTTIAQPPGDPNRFFVGNLWGQILILDLDSTTGFYRPRPFLDISDELDHEGEGGLLGLAFHPDYQTNGKFYVTVTVDNGGIPLPHGVPQEPPILSPFTAHVREYTVSPNPNVADTQYRKIIEWVKPQTVHTGGWLGFGPDDYLYIATGDGGGGYDNWPGHTFETGNAQDLTDNLHGKLLRIDVNSDDFADDASRNYSIPSSNPYVGKVGDDEIFAYGLRSPWKLSFDRATGDLWIGDVGEAHREEVDFIPAGSRGGQNFGWRKREGADPTPHPVGGQPPPGNTHPVYDYRHTSEPGDPAFKGNSITGGYVYRGPDPDLQGLYFFADFISSQIWMFDPRDPYGMVTNITSILTPSSGELRFISTFAEDSVGNLYIGNLWGDVYRILTDAVQPGDFQGDARVDGEDLLAWQENFGGAGGAFLGDSDFDGDVDGADFLDWQRHLGYDALHVPSAGSGNSAVPEPSGALLAAAAAMMICFTNVGRVTTCSRAA